MLNEGLHTQGPDRRWYIKSNGDKKTVFNIFYGEELAAAVVRA